MTVAYVSQSADNMWVGTSGPNPIPFEGLDQTTLSFSAIYGISDAIAIDIRTGLSEVSPQHGNPIPLTTDGRTDLELGLTVRILDEVVSSGPSVTVRVGAILAGDYEAGGPGPAEVLGDPARVGAGPTAIGDGADGFDLSVIVGKILEQRFALSAEVGLRSRSSDLPRETLVNLGAHWIASPRVVVSTQYHIQASSGDLDIGPPPGPGGHGTYWHRFPHVAEDISRVSLAGTFTLNDSISLGLHWFNVLDGRNTAEFQAFGATLTYNFVL